MHTYIQNTKKTSNSVLHGEILSSMYIPHDQPQPSVLLYIARPALVALDHSVQVTTLMYYCSYD